MANNAISNLQYASFYEQEDAPTEPVGSLQNYGGDLWWVSASGAAQLTSGNALNAADIGGIGGDYGGVNPASFRFVDADQTFYAYDDYAALEWARLAARSIDLYGDLDSTERVRLTVASGVSNYTITFPTDPPATQTLVQMEADGDIVCTNTLPANTHITLSGTGKIKHGQRVITLPVIFNDVFWPSGSGGFVDENTSGTLPGVVFGGLGTTTAYIPLPFPAPSNCHITGFGIDGESPTGNITYTLVYLYGSSSFSSTAITVTSASNNPTASGSVGANDYAWWLKVEVPTTKLMTIYSVNVYFESL
jgi:hypothetical protein